MKKKVDSRTLERWRSIPLDWVIVALAIHAKQDFTFKPLKDKLSTRWHATAQRGEFELVLTGPRFWDTRASVGGCGVVDLLVHLDGLGFKAAAERLTDLKI